MPRKVVSPRRERSAEPPVVILQLPFVSVSKDAGEAGVGFVTLQRPEKRNALSADVLGDIEKAFLFLQTRFDLNVIILAGAGKSFSAGAELSGTFFATGAGDERETRDQRPSVRQRRYASQLGRRVIRAIMDCEAITIARVQGHAIGGGFGLMQACDLRVVSADALLFFPEMDLGQGPVPWGLTPMLARDIGLPKAKELVLLCESVSPEEALSLGLINRVAATEAELDEIVDDFAFRLAAKPPGALHGAKSVFRGLESAAIQGDITNFEPDVVAAGAARL